MQEMMLTEREQEILRLLAEGLSDREIGARLFLTVGTVKWYNRQIFGKLHARNRTHAIEEARRRGTLGQSPSLPVTASATEPARPRSSLPAPVTSFIGRTREVQEITRVLHEARLVTLTGAPGTGKTRLALEVASTFDASFDDGAWFVPLAPLSDPDLVPAEICRVLGLHESAGQSPHTLLAGFLRDKSLMLVLDNVEHLLPAAPLVAGLLADAPRLVVLATSRERLHVYGEQEYPVPPLDLPPGGLTNSHALLACESVALFVQRARAALPGFALDDQNAAAVSAICVHLDGLPLAIELAAARVRFYSPQSLLLRLSSRLDTLSNGPRDLPTRQQTLRTTLAWSYDRLDFDEQRLFARLGVFAGGCTLDDAAAVCGAEITLPVAACIESLAEKNLLQIVHTGEGEPRVMMLETMREYALDQLQRSGELDSLRTRHMLHYLDLAETGGRFASSAQVAPHLEQMGDDQDNLRAALQWSLSADPTGQTSFRLLAALAHFWEVKGHLSEGRAWLVRVLAHAPADPPTRERADALIGIGDIAYLQCDYTAAEGLTQGALDIYERLNDTVGTAHALIGLGEIATEVGDYDTAPALFARAYALTRNSGDTLANARAVTQLGFGAMRAGDFAAARTWLEEGLELYRLRGQEVGAALVYSGMGELAVRQGRFDEAATLLGESLSILRDVGQPWGVAASLGSLAWVALLQRDWERAEDLLAESISIRREIGDAGGLAWCLEKLAEMARLRDDPERAIRIYGAAAALRTSVNSVIDPSDVDAYTAVLDSLRATVGDRFEGLWQEGQAMSQDQAIACALPGRDR